MEKGKQLWGNCRGSLWLRGFFGGLALIFFFYSIQELGLPKGTFIQSASAGITIVLLCPLLLPERFSPRALFAVLGSIIGLYLLRDKSFGGGSEYAQIIALVSGFFAGLSALMISKVGDSPFRTTPHRKSIHRLFYYPFLRNFLAIFERKRGILHSY